MQKTYKIILDQLGKVGSIIGVVIFEPRNKTYCFHLDRYTCYRCATGKCSLDDIALKDLEHLHYKFIPGKSNVDYCRGIAKKLLHNDFATIARIQYHLGCGHFSFSDGQHRTCAAARILNKGGNISLNAYLKVSLYQCPLCLMQAHLHEIKEKFTWIDIVFKTSRYKYVKNYDLTEFFLCSL